MRDQMEKGRGYMIEAESKEKRISDRSGKQTEEDI